MNPRIQLVAVICTVFLTGFVVNLVKQKKMREEYSLLWLFAIAGMCILAVYRPIVETIAGLLGIAYAPSALFIAALAVGFLLLIHFSIAISRLIERVKCLAQETVLLKIQLEELESSQRPGQRQTPHSDCPSPVTEDEPEADLSDIKTGI